MLFYCSRCHPDFCGKAPGSHLSGLWLLFLDRYVQGGKGEDGAPVSVSPLTQLDQIPVSPETPGCLDSLCLEALYLSRGRFRVLGRFFALLTQTAAGLGNIDPDQHRGKADPVGQGQVLQKYDGSDQSS